MIPAPAATAGAWEDAGGLVLLAAATFVAAAVNSVAGGGTVITFPVLAALLPAGAARLVVANATSTIGLVPGAAAAAWAYRGERASQPAWTRWLFVPSVVGAVLGSVLVLALPPGWFAAAVPWLVLLAAILFTLQPRIVRALPVGPPDAVTARAVGPRGVAVACLAQLLVAVYGGYFGAGIGILMLAVLGFLGLGDIHRLNGLKNALGTVVNTVAAVVFVLGSAVGPHAVSWPHAAVMAAAAVAGGLGGSQLARRLPAAVVRRCVAIIAFALAGYYLLVSPRG